MDYGSKKRQVDKGTRQGKQGKLTPGNNRPDGWERIHNQREARPQQKDDVAEEAERAQPEGSMADVIATLDEQTDDRDGVGHIQQYNARRHHAIEGRVAANIKKPENRDDDIGHEMRAEGYIDSAINMRKPFRTRDTTIPCKTPAQPRLPRMRRDKTPEARRDEHGLQHDGARPGSQRLIVQSEDGYQRVRAAEVAQVVHAEEEGDGVEP